VRQRPGPKKKRKKRNDNNFTRQPFFTSGQYPAADSSMAKKKYAIDETVLAGIRLNLIQKRRESL
jgi:hypothetical protein